jgi:hypothetical protein
MVVYGGGFVDVVSDIAYDFELPTWGDPAYQLYTFNGENRGQDNGFKGKLDYSGKLWGIAGSKDEVTGEITPTVVWRATLNPNLSITLDIDDLPEINTDGDLPVPNQLTIDRLGNIYFPGGATLDDTYSAVIIKGEITELPTFSIEYTITNVYYTDTKTLCVTLAPDHLHVYTYMQRTGENTDQIYEYLTSDLSIANSKGVNTINEAFTGHYNPYNMETDSNPDSPNYGYMYCIINDVTYACIGWTVAFAATGYQTTIIEIGDEPVTIDIDEGALPVYYFTERVSHVGGQIVNTFNPNLPTTLLVELAQEILTVPLNSPTHADTDRDSANQDFYTGSALGDETNAVIRQVLDHCTGVQDDLAYLELYQKVWVSGRRELYHQPA